MSSVGGYFILLKFKSEAALHLLFVCDCVLNITEFVTEPR